jgi:drug/metabolite transporter (DMT)-like permease
MIYWITSALAFFSSVAISIVTAQWLMAHYKSRLVALVGTAAMGFVLSVLSDFTFAYSADEYDRSFQMVTERGLISAVISALVGYLALKSGRTN